MQKGVQPRRARPPQMPIMLCSATPTFTKRSETARETGAMLPAGEMSATTMNTLGVTWAIMVQVRAKVSLTVTLHHFMEGQWYSSGDGER